ncbi:YebC/PmpR family DNA-binding transcriptional regulator [Catenisphaera adipataccumulans]|jgi:YebC/PmpR family DNA-binding regulatory protein|uniref:Probable transcriptional regulatory protein HNQ47_001312 n=1 Tax=Catenisphaera adipataccumulans TaxID=700500 RepID=A0A7W8CX97_9FIRM|nr:YebC/PmpR family DNA-binding transcriptional regulator [Catenisphaera adipataccumulans]MBB5183291.1 YebC/PmpR family DNA-binding regulatory protein [Catenisphaera adipataccumulans]
MGRHFEVRAASMQKTANAKAKVYSRYSKEILVAAKNGDPDPDMNQALKKAIERAKANNVPNDVIKRAIDKAKSNTSENYSSARYEGFGNGGSTIIIDCLTDNPNRTIAYLRACFNKSHAKLGVSGSVSFGYEHLGVIVIQYDDEDAMMEALLDADIDLHDIEVEEGYMTITVDPTQLDDAKKVIEKLIPDVKFEVFEDKMVANDMVNLQGEDLELFQRLVKLLDDVDDVQHVYHNVENINEAA